MFWLWAIFTACIFYFALQTVNRYFYWRKKGIPGPVSWPIVGRFLDTLVNGVGRTDIRMTRQFGRIIGYFEGPNPVIMTSDVEMIKSVLVKDFSHFPNRRSLDFNGELLDKGVSVLTGQRWKEVRSILVPVFSSAKMRQMSSLINECSQSMLVNLDSIAVNHKEFEAKRFFGSVTMDVISSTFFGMKIDSQNDPNNPFVKHAEVAFNGFLLNPAVLISILFPNIAPLMRRMGFQLVPKETIQFFVDITEKIMKLRIESGQVRRDFLQLMLNSMENAQKSSCNDFSNPEITTRAGMMAESGNRSEPDVLSEMLANSNEGKKPQLYSDYKLTSKEVVAQAVSFFLAGYETTATALAFLAYEIAVNPEIQDRLRQEIGQVIGYQTKPDYDLIAKLEYLDMCVNEALRKYPPVARTERQCAEDWNYNGVKYEKGTVVVIPTWALHHDPEYWPEPEVFKPERFSKENESRIIPHAFQTFGQGPRNCLGMRFVYFEMKMVMVTILQKFRLVTNSRTEIPLEIRDVGLISAKNGVWLTLEKIE